MTKRRLAAVFIGPPGSGKHTQGELLAAAFDVPFLSVGLFLREEMAEKTSLGKLIEEYVEYGMLAPDELVNAILLKRLHGKDLSRGFVLDGYPRNIEQAQTLDRLQKVTVAIHLKLSDHEAALRVEGRRVCPKCLGIFHLKYAPPGELETCRYCGGGLQGRSSDHPDVFHGRLAVYHFMTEPLVSYYRKRGVLLSVSSDREILSQAQFLEKKIRALGIG